MRCVHCRPNPPSRVGSHSLDAWISSVRIQKAAVRFARSWRAKYSSKWRFSGKKRTHEFYVNVTQRLRNILLHKISMYLHWQNVTTKDAGVEVNTISSMLLS